MASLCSLRCQLIPVLIVLLPRAKSSRRRHHDVLSCCCHRFDYWDQRSMYFMWILASFELFGKIFRWVVCCKKVYCFTTAETYPTTLPLPLTGEHGFSVLLPLSTYSCFNYILLPIGRRDPVDDIATYWAAAVTVLFIGTRWWIKHVFCVDIGNLQCHTIERQCGLWSCGLHAWLASKSVYRVIVIVTAIVSITDSSYSFIRHAMSDCSLTNPFLYITGICENGKGLQGPRWCKRRRQEANVTTPRAAQLLLPSLLGPTESLHALY